MFPKLITRYVAAELLKVFLSTLTVFTLLMTMVGVAQEAVRQGLGLVPILRIIPYTLPNALVFALPGTILFSVCLVFGRMSASRELVAMKSLGIPATAVVRPALGLAFLVSLVTVWLIDVAFSWGYAGIQRVILESAEEIAYGVLRTQRSYSTRQFSISVSRVLGRRLLQPTVTIRRPNGEDVMMTAREAQLYAAVEEAALKITLTDGFVEIGRHAAPAGLQADVHSLPAEQLVVFRHGRPLRARTVGGRRSSGQSGW